MRKANIHERIMEASGISGTYELFDIDPKEIDRYAPILMRELHGFNVTIPYKEKIIAHLEELDPLAGRLRAVNTVFGKRGYNTDRNGFSACGVDLRDKKVLILGAGGVARMLAFEAADAGSSIDILALLRDQAEALARDLSPFAKSVRVADSEQDAAMRHPDVVLNATPVGMWPQYGSLTGFSEFVADGMNVFDTVYNPPATRFVLRARKEGAKASGGLPMLFYQALAAQKIWNPDADFNDRRLLPILQDLPRKMLRKSPVKMILTGFMGCGKTTVGRLLAENLGVSFVDLDEEITRVCGCSIAEIFARDGEGAFRKIETDLYREYLKRPGSLVIACGGGLILRAENRLLTEELGALNVFLDAPREIIWERIKADRSRPLAGTPDEPEAERFMKVARLYEARLPEYQKHADTIISANREPEQIARDVADALGYGG